MHRHPPAVVATDEHGLDRFHQPADTGDEVTDCRAERCFDDAVLCNAAAAGEHRRARLAGRAYVRIAVAHPREDRELRECLGVGKQGVTSADPARRSDRLHELWPAPAAVDEPDDGAALAGGELVRYDVHS